MTPPRLSTAMLQEIVKHGDPPMSLGRAMATELLALRAAGDALAEAWARYGQLVLESDGRRWTAEMEQSVRAVDRAARTWRTARGEG